MPLCFDLLSLSCPLLFCSRHHSNCSHTSVKLSMSVYFGSHSFLLSPGILFCVQFGFRLTGGPVYPLHPKSIWHKKPSIIIPLGPRINPCFTFWSWYEKWLHNTVMLAYFSVILNIFCTGFFSSSSAFKLSFVCTFYFKRDPFKNVFLHWVKIFGQVPFHSLLEVSLFLLKCKEM